MYIKGQVYPMFTDPEIMGLSENPEPTVESGVLRIHVTGRGNRYRVNVGDLCAKKEAAKRTFERCIYAAGNYFELAGVSKKEALTMFHNVVFGDWAYGKKK